MIITALNQKGNNVLVCFDDGEFITLDYRTVLDNGLRKNDFIDEQKKTTLLNESDFLKAKDSAFRFLGRRHHSTSELKVKLIKKKYPKDIIDRVLTELTEKKFLDDTIFAHAFIEERSVRKKVGITKLKAELFRKGIDRKVIENSLSVIDPEISFSNALQLGQRKYDSLLQREIDKNKIRTKIFAFLSSRGYESEIIIKVINELVRGEEE